jgi:hypothetical protein
MYFVEVAIGAIAVGVVIMVGYLVIANVKTALPTSSLDNATKDGIDQAQTTVYAGFGLIAVGIIVLAAFGLISVFQ